MHLPLTGVAVVDRIITDLAVMDITPHGIKVVEMAPGVTDAEPRARPACRCSDRAILAGCPPRRAAFFLSGEANPNPELTHIS